MTEREQYSLEFKRLLQDRPYILKNSKKYIPLSEYLQGMGKKFNLGFIYIVPPVIYRLDILDYFQDRIVYTTQLGNAQGAPQLFTLVQVDRNTHLYFTYYFIENKFSLGVEIYTSEADFVIDFMEKYGELEINPTVEKATGFGALK